MLSEDEMTALADYYALIDRIDEDCGRIRRRYGAHIVCRQGCPGNCCRIHLSIFTVEAVALALALRTLSPLVSERIRRKAAAATTFGPCPLLEDGACMMYAARLVICRTHGLPMRTAYRGQRSVGCCQKNFRGIGTLPEDALIDLDRVNRDLAAVNARFVAANQGRFAPKYRLLICEALLLDPSSISSHRPEGHLRLPGCF